MRLIIDAGMNGWTRHDLAKEFIDARSAARSVSIVFLWLGRSNRRVFGNGKDVMRMVPRCIWETRGHTSEWTINKQAPSNNDSSSTPNATRNHTQRIFAYYNMSFAPQ